MQNRWKAAFLMFVVLLGCMAMSACTAAGNTSQKEMSKTVFRQLGGNLSLDMENKEAQIENEAISLTLDLRQGIVVRSLRDKILDHEYLKADIPLFQYKVRSDGNYGSNLEVVRAETADGYLIVLARDKAAGLSFTVKLYSDEDATVTFYVELDNESGEEQTVYTILPCIGALKMPDQSEAMACVPQEIGQTGELSGQYYGMGIVPDWGLSTGMNSMEVGTVYAASGKGGIFVADRDGSIDGSVLPIQIRIERESVGGYWVKRLASGESASTPNVAIGVYRNGDWHAAVDYYTAHHVDVNNSYEIPQWFRESGGVFCGDRTSSGGAIYLSYNDDKDLKESISSFEELPKVLNKARRLGTDVIYLLDYYERADLSGVPNRELKPDEKYNILTHFFWNKGDYQPRADLGGEEALIKGIAAVHEEGGKVILYMEPYIIFKYSELGKAVGEQWAARDRVSGEIREDFKWCYTMCSCFKPWQDTVLEICRRLVQDYGADGIMLDSWGWRWNQSYYNEAESRIYSSEEISRGVIELNDRVRDLVREINPEAVVISESGSGPLIYHNDGGFCCDFGWGQSGDGILRSSPTRYGLPEANLFSGGTTLSQMYQVFAAGYGFQLSDQWLLEWKAIAPLVEIRKNYADALIYGVQEYQPETYSSDVTAYIYNGESNRILILVNLGKAGREDRLLLQSKDAGSKWENLLSGEILSVDEDGVLSYSVKKEGILILRRLP